MKRKMILTATVIAIAALTAVPFVYAGPGRHMHGDSFGGGGPHGMAMFGHLARLQEKLDLSDQQVDQLKAIFADVHQQNAQYRDQLHGGMKSIAETLIKNPNDVAAAQALLDQQTAAENAMKTNILQATSKALNVLNADQREKLGTMLADHMGRHREAREQ